MLPFSFAPAAAWRSRLGTMALGAVDALSDDDTNQPGTSKPESKTEAKAKAKAKQSAKKTEEKKGSPKAKAKTKGLAKSKAKASEKTEKVESSVPVAADEQEPPQASGSGAKKKPAAKAVLKRPAARSDDAAEKPKKAYKYQYKDKKWGIKYDGHELCTVGSPNLEHGNLRSVASSLIILWLTFWQGETCGGSER